MNIVLFGAPGAGKGAQAERIASLYGMVHLSTGEMLRSAISSGSDLGVRAKDIIDRGELISDDIIVKIVNTRLDEDDCVQGVILDGFPRTIPQAEALIQRNIDIDAVVEIDVPDQDIIDRMSGRRMHPASGRNYHVVYNPPKIEGKDDLTGEDLIQREDDKPETVKDRLRVYADQTSPLIEFYSDLSNTSSLSYVKVLGTASPQEVTNQIFINLDS